MTEPTKLVHTLKSKARCLQSPTDRLPMGSTIDPRQSFRSSLHPFDMETKSSSPSGAAPLHRENKVNYKKKKKKGVSVGASKKKFPVLTPNDHKPAWQADQQLLLGLLN